jgi:hypothetical protein
VRDALRRHRWAIAAIFVASWGWALAWPQGVVTSRSGGAGTMRTRFSDSYTTSSYGYSTRGWGVSGVFQVGTSSVTVERFTDGVKTEVPVAEARAIVLERVPDAFGREGWFVDWGSFALACWLGTLFSVVTSVWWVAFRRPVPAERSPGRVVAGVLGMAIWPTLLLSPAGWSIWRQLGSPKPQTLIVLDPELMIMATVYLVSVIAVRLGRPRSSPAT